MPELPEVETIVRNLSRGGTSIVGRRILAARLLWPRSLETPSPTEFEQRIVAQVITAVSRRGKFALFHLTSDTLLVHLRMSGDLFSEPTTLPVGRHHRLILDLEGELRLAFVDPRKFGRIWLVADPATVLRKLGPEPLAADFSPQIFQQRLRQSRRQLKPLLLDQSFIAGLGNIYTDEALHLAKIHPQRIAATVSEAEAERLWRAIRQVLSEGIRRSGTSIDWVYRGGDFQNHLRVYQRTGQPCPECGAPVQRISLGQRGTHFCPQCQSMGNSP